LGSSAAARVGALVAANEWARLRGYTAATTEEILDFATDMEGHPDNAAAALLGGLVVSVARDSASAAGKPGSTVAVKLPVAQSPSFLVWVPDSELATKEARATLPETYSRADAVFNISRTGLLMAALATADLEALRDALHDRLHQPFRAPLMPGYNEVVEAACQAGALGATLSGAGSSILLWLPPEAASVEQTVRTAVREASQQCGVTGQLLSLPVDTQGCIALPQNPGSR
jgi:homoserine kinase